MSKSKSGKYSRSESWERRVARAKERLRKAKKYPISEMLDDEDEYDNWIPDINYRR